jgi:hypothetical protein
MEINGGDLVLYINDKPVAVCSGTLTLPESFDYVSCLEPESERTVEVSGIGLPEINLTPIQEWNYQWYRSGELPRKEKKAYRKKLLKMLS